MTPVPHEPRRPGAPGDGAGQPADDARGRLYGEPDADAGLPEPPARPRLPRSAAVLGAVVGLLLLFAAVGVGTTSTTSGAAAAHPAVQRVEATLAFIFLAWLVVVAIAAAVWALTMRGAGPPIMFSQRRRVWPAYVAIVVAALLFRWWIGFGGHRKTRPPQVSISGHPTPQPKPTGPGVVDTNVALVGFVVAVVLTALAVAGYTWWARRQRGFVPARHAAEEQADEPVLAEAVDQALADLATVPDPRLAVIAAYARMERVLRARGLPRRPAETPLEYLDRVLRELGGQAVAVDRLTALFEEAKFSRHPIGEPHRHDAIAALEALRAGLGVPA